MSELRGSIVSLLVSTAGWTTCSNISLLESFAALAMAVFILFFESFSPWSSSSSSSISISDVFSADMAVPGDKS